MSQKGMSTSEKEMKELFGFVPAFFRESLPEQAHDEEWSVFKEYQLGETVLPNKVKQLIGLSMAAHIKCKYCIYFHTEAARALGATDEELKEACFMGGHTVQMSNSISGMAVDFEQFKQDTDRAIQHMMQTQQSQQPSPH